MDFRFAMGLAVLAVLASCSPQTGSSVDSGLLDDDAGSSAPDAGERDAGPADAGVLELTWKDLGPVADLAPRETQHEPFIAVSKSGAKAVVWQLWQPSAGRITLAYRVSAGAGLPLGPVQVLSPLDGANIMANAQVAAMPNDGFLLSWVSLRRTATGRTNIHVWVALAAQGQMTFGAPVDIADPSESVTIHDLPSVVVTATGKVHVVWTKELTNGQVFITGASSDDAVTWRRTTVAGPGTLGSFRTFSGLCTGGANELPFVTWFDTDGGIKASRLKPDGSWSSPVLVSLPEEQSKLVGSNTSCVSDGTSAWVIYGLGQVTTSATVPIWSSIRLVRLEGDGPAVSTRGVVTGLSTPALMQPTAALGSDGRLHVLFFGGQMAGDANGALWATSTTDGTGFSAVKQVLGPIKLETSRAVDTWLGDYYRVVSSGAGFIGVVPTNSTGAAQVRLFQGDPVAR